MCSSKNYNIQIYQFVEMPRDFKSSWPTFSSLVIFMYWPYENHTVNATPTDKRNGIASFLQWTAPIARFFVKFAPGTTFTSWSKHHLFWLERLSSKSARLHTVAASNNKDPTSCSFCFCLFATHGCCSSHTSRSWWIAHSPQRYLRGCNTCSKVGLDFLKWLRVKH